MTFHDNSKNIEHTDISPAGQRKAHSLRWVSILLVAWVISGIYSGMYLKRGWYPWDIGAYAQSADRVLHGELPHLDYTDTYTGGLAFLNAFAFNYLGENFATPRLVLFCFFLAWIPAVYWIASQFAPDWVAGSLTFLAVAWSLPNYSEAVPSWYNLIFATYGLASLFAYLRRPSPKWLFLAGLCGGFSFLAKSAGLFYIAAVLLFFVYREQSAARSNDSQSNRRTYLYSAFVSVCLALFLILLIGVTLRHSLAPAFVMYVLPSASLVCLLLLNEWRIFGRAEQDRFMELLHMSAVFGGGAAIPILLFLVPYVRAHAIRLLINDLIIQASSRISLARLDPPELLSLAPVLLLASLLCAGALLRGWARGVAIASVTGLFAIGLALSGRYWESYQAVFFSAYWVIPLLAVTGFITLRRLESSHDPQVELKRQQLFLLLSITALCSLVQFPYASSMYFCYVAPLAILAGAMLFRTIHVIPRSLGAVLFISYLLLAVLRMNPASIDNLDTGMADAPREFFYLSRAGNLRVHPETVSVYKKLIALIQEHAGPGEIYAGPDSPEVYFLAGYRNPTRTIYDFLEDQNGRYESILQTIDSRPIRVVVLNKKPFASATIPTNLHEALAQRFPESEVVGNFEVRWRDEVAVHGRDLGP